MKAILTAHSFSRHFLTEKKKAMKMFRIKFSKIKNNYLTIIFLNSKLLLYKYVYKDVKIKKA